MSKKANIDFKYSAKRAEQQASKAIARSETNKLAIARPNALAIARKKT